MNINNLVPWRREENNAPVQRDNDESFYALQQEVNRVFDNFWSDFDLGLLTGSRISGFNPSVDVQEGDKEIIVTAELPGMSEQDIDITLTQNSLTIKGEKKALKEDKGQNYYRMERSYGLFARTVPLPADVVDRDKVEASFNKGVLAISLPKLEQAQKRSKRISVKSV